MTDEPFKLVLFLFLAIQLSGCKKEDHTRHYSEGLYSSATRLAMAGLADSGIRKIDSAYRSFPTITTEDKFRYFEFKNAIFSSHYNRIGNSDSSLAYADSMLILIEKQGLVREWTREYAKAYSCKGLAFSGQNKYTEAFRFLSMSKFIAAGIPDSCLIANYDQQLANILYYQARYREASLLYIQSLNGASDCMNAGDRFYLTQGNMNSIALCYHYMRMNDSAMYYFEKGREYIGHNRQLYAFDPVFPDIALGILDGNEAEVWQDKGDYEKARQLYKRSVAINDREGYDRNDAMGSVLSLARLYLQTGSLDSALHLLISVQTQVKQTEKNDQLYWLKLMWQSQTAAGHTALADSFHIRFLEFKDSVREQKKQILPANADSAYQNLSNLYVLNLLKKKNQVKTVYLSIFIVLAIKAILLLFLLWRSWRKSRHHVYMLETLNDLIVRQNGHVMKAFHALEQSQSDNARMMKIVAHDLRGPIGGILNVTEMLKEGMIDAAKYRDSLSLMHQAASGSLILIDDLLNLNLSGKDIVRDRIELQDLLQYCIDLMKHSAAHKGQHILFHATPAVIEGDREKLWRVFSNLLSNAVKFSRETALIELLMEIRSDKVIVIVKDQGIGIPEHLQDKIFDMVTDARRKGTSGESSFGLGLAISRQIVELHNGKLWFESQQGRGTCFFVQLPLAV